MAASVAGPSKLNGSGSNGQTVKSASTNGKIRKEPRSDEDHYLSDNSMSSRSSTGSRKRAKSNASVTSASDMDEERSTTENRLRNWKGKGAAVSAFQDVQPIIDIPIPPALCHTPLRAAEELMDSLLMRYVPELDGVLLSHEDISFQRNLGTLDADGAFSIAPAAMSLRVWAPKIAMRLEGRIILSTPSHVSLLVHDKFNASITSSHLPSVLEMGRMKKEKAYRWHEFTEEEWNRADTEMAEQAEGNDDEERDQKDKDDWKDAAEKSTGYWVSVATGQKLGGEDGKVTFTVVGLTIANHMLSVHGSLLRKPFSIPAPTYVPSIAELGRQKSDSIALADTSRRVRFQESDEERSDDEDAEEVTREADEIAANVPTPTDMQIDEVDASDKKKKKRSKVGPRREWDTSGSESEADTRREKKKRRKD